MENDKSLDLAMEFVRRTDELNRRLVRILLAICVAGCALIGFIVGAYFFADYGYPDNNLISNNYSDNNKNTIGGSDHEKTAQRSQSSEAPQKAASVPEKTEGGITNGND